MNVENSLNCQGKKNCPNLIEDEFPWELTDGEDSIKLCGDCFDDLGCSVCRTAKASKDSLCLTCLETYCIKNCDSCEITIAVRKGESETLCWYCQMAS